VSIGTVIDGEPNVATQALALKRALVEIVADAGMAAIDTTTMALLNQHVDLAYMQKFGGGVAIDKGQRATVASARVGNFAAAQVETYLAAIDAQLKKLGGT
jgi:hypothetical protein